MFLKTSLLFATDQDVVCIVVNMGDTLICGAGCNGRHLFQILSSCNFQQTRNFPQFNKLFLNPLLICMLIWAAQISVDGIWNGRLMLLRFLPDLLGEGCSECARHIRCTCRLQNPKRMTSRKLITNQRGLQLRREDDGKREQSCKVNFLFCHQNNIPNGSFFNIGYIHMYKSHGHSDETVSAVVDGLHGPGGPCRHSSNVCCVWLNRTNVPKQLNGLPISFENEPLGRLRPVFFPNDPKP